MKHNYSNPEEEAYISSSKYELLITNGKLGGWEFNFKTGDFWCSREYFEMLNRATESMPKWDKYPLKEGWIDLLHPDDLVGAQAYFAEYLKNWKGYTNRLYACEMQMALIAGFCVGHKH